MWHKHRSSGGGGGAERELALSGASSLPACTRPCPACWAAHQHFAVDVGLVHWLAVTGGVAWHQRMVLSLATGLRVGQAERWHEGTLC